jgi:hypothetical protein
MIIVSALQPEVTKNTLVVEQVGSLTCCRKGGWPVDGLVNMSRKAGKI